MPSSANQPDNYRLRLTLCWVPTIVNACWPVGAPPPSATSTTSSQYHDQAKPMGRPRDLCSYDILRNSMSLAPPVTLSLFLMFKSIYAGCRMVVFLARSWGAKILVPLRSHSVGRGTSVPTGRTDACRRTDCASRREPATVAT